MSSYQDQSEYPLLASPHPGDIDSRLIRHQKQEYQNNASESPPICHRRCILNIVLLSIISCLATLIFIATVGALLHSRAVVTITAGPRFTYDKFFSTTSSRQTGCGSTVEEALARDCRWDELSDLWLPRKCSQKYEVEYLLTNDGGPFLYWADPGGKEVITNRSVYAGGATYYSTTRDHLRHCEYNLYRFADSLTTGDPVGHAGDFGPHIHHCAEILGKFANLAPNIDRIDVDTRSEFGFC